MDVVVVLVILVVTTVMVRVMVSVRISVSVGACVRGGRGVTVNVRFRSRETCALTLQLGLVP